MARMSLVALALLVVLCGCRSGATVGVTVEARVPVEGREIPIGVTVNYRAPADPSPPLLR